MSTLWGRLLLLVFVLGCTVSAIASGRFGVRLIVDGAVSFAFVPAIEVAAFAVVYRTIARARPNDTSRDGSLATHASPASSFSRALDIFLTGNTPWLLWLIAIAALASAVPPRSVGPWLVPGLFSAIVPGAWSIWLDFRFFRDVLARSTRGAIRDLVLHRAIGWTAATAYFFGLAIWAEIVPKFIGH